MEKTSQFQYFSYTTQHFCKESIFLDQQKSLASILSQHFSPTEKQGKSLVMASKSDDPYLSSPQKNPGTSQISNTPSEVPGRITKDEKYSDQGQGNLDEKLTDTKSATELTSTCNKNTHVQVFGKKENEPKVSNDRRGFKDVHRQKELHKKAVPRENPAFSNSSTEVSGGSKMNKESTNITEMNDSASTSIFNERPNAKKKMFNDGDISEYEEEEQNWSSQSKNFVVTKSKEVIFSLDVTHLELFEDVNVGVALFLDYRNNFFFELRYYLCKKIKSGSKSTNSYRVLLPKSQIKSNQFFMKVFLIKQNVELLPENFLKESEEIRLSADEQRLNSINLGPIGLSETKQSTDDNVTCANDESSRKQEGLKITLKEMIKNESIDKYKPLKGKVIGLNVIIGTDVIDPRAISMTVAVSFFESHQGFVEGYIVCETEEHMWIKFYFQPLPTAKEMLYKYHLIKIMKNDDVPKTESETLEDSSMFFTRTLLLSEVSHWCEGKFDGKIQFAGKTVKRKKSGWNSVINFFSGFTDADNFIKNQNWTAIPIYLDLIFRIFVSAGETSTLVRSIKSLFSSLGHFRWMTGDDGAKEGKIDDHRLINMALAQTCTLFESHYENYIDGKPTKDTVLFKLGVVLMLCYVDNIWPVIGSKNLKKVLELIALTVPCDREEIVSAISLLGIHLNVICIGLREYCADMLTEKCCKLTEHPVFMALIDWAYLDDSEFFLKKAHKFQISATFFENCKPHCKSFASVKHLLTFALSSRLRNHLRENWDLSLADVIGCIMQLHRNNISLSMTSDG